MSEVFIDLPMHRRHAALAILLIGGGVNLQFRNGVVASLAHCRSIRKWGCGVSVNDRSSLMARGTFAHRSVLASLQCEIAVTIAAEHVKGGFTRLAQIRARASVTVETAAETRMVDEVVMAGDAIDGSMIFMWEIHMQRERCRCRLQQTRTTRRRRQRQQNGGRDTAGNHGG
jgi:hypothetical protein